MSQLILNNQADAGLSTPSAGKAKVGASTNNKILYSKDENGNECAFTDIIQMLTASYTLTSQTAAQKLLNASTNGAFTVEALTTYWFELQFDLSSMSATSNSFGFAIGGTATFTNTKWWSYANKAAIATAAAPQATVNIGTTAVTANVAITSATTNTVGWAHICGWLRTNAAGTIIPQVSLQTAAAAVVGIGSYMRLSKKGLNTTTQIGNWS